MADHNSSVAEQNSHGQQSEHSKTDLACTSYGGSSLIPVSNERDVRSSVTSPVRSSQWVRPGTSRATATSTSRKYTTVGFPLGGSRSGSSFVNNQGNTAEIYVQQKNGNTQNYSTLTQSANIPQKTEAENYQTDLSSPGAQSPPKPVLASMYIKSTSTPLPTSFSSITATAATITTTTTTTTTTSTTTTSATTTSTTINSTTTTASTITASTITASTITATTTTSTTTTSTTTTTTISKGQVRAGSLPPLISPLKRDVTPPQTIQFEYVPQTEEQITTQKQQLAHQQQQQKHQHLQQQNQIQSPIIKQQLLHQQKHKQPTNLFEAAFYGREDLVRHYLQAPSSPTTQPSHQALEERKYIGTPLHYAADQGHLEVVNILLEAGFSPHEYTLNYYQELLPDLNPEAAEELSKAGLPGSPQYQEVLKKHIDGGERTPLHLAIQGGHVALVDVLCRTPGSLHMKTRWSSKSDPEHDKSSLHLACEGCYTKIAKMLLSHSKFESFSTDRLGESPLYAVCRKGDVEMLKLLVDHGVKLESLYSSPTELLNELVDSGLTGEIGEEWEEHSTRKPQPSPIEFVTDIELISVLVLANNNSAKTKLSKEIKPRMDNVRVVVKYLTDELESKKNSRKGPPLASEFNDVIIILRNYVEDKAEFDRIVNNDGNNDQHGVGIASINRSRATSALATGLPIADPWTLTLRHQSLRSLPPEVSRITHLTTLKLDSNRLTEIPDCVCNLKALVRLSLRHNQIRVIPENFSKLDSLVKLSLHNNQIITVADVTLASLTALVHLSLSLNKLSRIPPVIGDLTLLQLLELGSNKIENVPSELGKLTNLTYLSLYGNSIRQIPPSLALLVDIKAMVLDKNLIQEFPTSFVNFPDPSKITIAHNFSGQIYTLSEYLYDFSAGEKKCTKLKIIVLGHGGVGKTTLLNGLKKKNVSVLKRNKVSLQTRTTVGIDIDAQKLKLHNAITFQVWDFAGQSEYSTTHQYFLSQSRVIYLLVVSLTRDIRSQIDYWLSYVSTKVEFRGKRSFKFILIGSKLDQLSPEEVQKMKALFENIVKEFAFDEYHFISSLSLQGLGELQKSIVSAAKDLLDGKDSKRIPLLYLQTLDDIKRQSKSIVTTEFNIQDAKVLRAISFLHDIGDIIYHRPSGSVCTDPQALAKMMALFVCPEEHSNTLLGYINQESQRNNTSILPQQQAILKLKLLAKSLGLPINDSSAPYILEAMDLFGFCVKLSKEEEVLYGQSGVLFPALRPAGQFQWMLFEGPTWTLGARITDLKSRVILPQVFFQIQLSLRKFFLNKNLQKPIIMYANGMQIHQEDNVAQFLLQPSSKFVDILVRGTKIRDFWRHIQAALASVREDMNGTTFEFLYLHPHSLYKDLKTFPLDLAAVQVISDNNSANVNPTYYEYGVKAENASFKIRYPWEFVAGIESNPGDWLIEPGMSCYHLILEPPPSGMEWQNPAYQQEFEAVRQAFDFFVGNDVAETFKLDKVVVLNNKHLQSKFESVYLKFRSRPPASRTRLEADPEKREWREWVMSNLSKYVKNISGDEQTNLVLGWHGGATEEICKIIGESNFKIMGKTDAGYFGAGIYFTQYPSYGDLYVQEKIRKVELEKSQKQNTNRPHVSSVNNFYRNRDRKSEGNSSTSSHRQFPLLLSWILLGNVYPVTENPQGNAETSLFGKPCVPGYDSHYVLVKKVGNMNYFPCPIDHPAGPDYDELVVFNPDQILPRYLIYYSSTDKLSENPRTILWVDHNHTTHATIIKQLQADGYNLKLLSKTQELKDWIQRYGLKLSKHERKELRIISNRNRPGDGDETAGERLCQWLKDPKSMWSSTPILLFTDDKSAVTFPKDWNSKKKIWVTESIEVVHAFITEPDLKVLPE